VNVEPRSFLTEAFMPEVLHPTQTPLPPFPAGQGKGSMFAPLAQDTAGGIVRAHAVQTINAGAESLYRLWRRVELAPRWQEYVVSVEEKSEGLSHWVIGDPEADPADTSAKRIEFDSEIVEDIPGRKIAWQSVTEGVTEAGEVTFEPTENDRGTLVTLQERVGVPGGALGNAAAAVARRTPRQIVVEDLRHFKQLAEAGEIPSVVGQPNGKRGFTGSLKAKLYGENNPTPPGTSER
jgi:uncharacterized membrane protein